MHRGETSTSPQLRDDVQGKQLNGVKVRRPGQRSQVDALPVELLAHIFLLGYDNGIDSRRPFKRREIEPESNWEVIVSHVCRHWRNIALDTPQLWTNIRLRKLNHLERGAEYVRRSRKASLDILVDTVDPQEYAEAEPGSLLGIKEFDDAFKVAIEHTERWRSLILKVCDLPCKGRARANLRDCPPIPNLQTLQLWHVQQWEDTNNMLNATVVPPIPILGDYVPSLLNASLVGVNLAYDKTSYLKGLRHLELALHSHNCRPTSEEFESILRDCPDLERLSLHYSGPQVDHTHHGAQVRLERLRELSLVNMDLEVLQHVVRRVAMPNLVSLELDLPEMPDAGGLDFTPVVEYLAMLTAPAFPLLEHLAINALACSLPSWTSWLPVLPRLRTLELDFSEGRLPHTFFDPLCAPAHGVPTHPAPAAASPGSPAPLSPGSGSPPRSPSPTSPVGISSAGTSPIVSSVPGPQVLLPHLEELKTKGLESSHLMRFAAFRRSADVRVPKFLVHIKSVDPDTDALERDHEVKYFGLEDVVDEDEDEEEEYSEDEGEEGEESGSENMQEDSPSVAVHDSAVYKISALLS
ncbi:hypothetical protein PENSPDRAFT_651744 [Peniophora sp. CONT]|nr:hypothetical protein PENSPDRAFT_651744 [Peniophora sp. CONT]